MHGEKNSTASAPIAVDLSFTSEPWWSNRKEVPRGYLLEELDDIWEEQESAPDLGFEDFESRILDFDQGEKDKTNLDLEDSELVDNILNILLSRNLSDATLGSADFHNKRNAMESALKGALSKHSHENRRKEDLFERKKGIQISVLHSESDIDDEIQFLEEEIERLKERKRNLRNYSNRNDSSSENFDSSPPSVPLSPVPSPTTVSPMVTISSPSERKQQPCSCSNCNAQNNVSLSENSTPRKRMMAGMTDADVEEESPKDKRKRRKTSKNPITSENQYQVSILETTSTELISPPKARKLPSKPKKKTVGKKSVQLFKTEEVLKIKNVGSGDVEEDVDILN